MASAEVEETIRRLSSHKGVEGIVISTYEGVALKSTLSAELTTRYAGLMSQLVLKARGAVRTIDAEVRARGSHWLGGAGGWLLRPWLLSSASPSFPTAQLKLPLLPLLPPLLPSSRMTWSFFVRARASTRS